MNEKLLLADGTELEQVFCRPDTLTDVPYHYCPGCGHSVVHNVLMEVVDELDIQDKTIGVAPVGCSVFAYHYMNIDMQEAAHGRASAVATGIKRVLPDKLVFSYQAMVILLQSVPRKQFTLLTVVKIFSSYLLTMEFMV